MYEYVCICVYIEKDNSPLKNRKQRKKTAIIWICKDKHVQ